MGGCALADLGKPIANPSRMSEADVSCGSPAGSAAVAGSMRRSVGTTMADMGELCLQCGQVTPARSWALGAPGLSAVLSRGSPEAVTGRKRDCWLVQTVGGLMAVTGAVLATAGCDERSEELGAAEAARRSRAVWCPRRPFSALCATNPCHAVTVAHDCRSARERGAPSRTWRATPRASPRTIASSRGPSLVR
jgi:hypothetical protein